MCIHYRSGTKECLMCHPPPPFPFCPIQFSNLFIIAITFSHKICPEFITTCICVLVSSVSKLFHYLESISNHLHPPSPNYSSAAYLE